MDPAESSGDVQKPSPASHSNNVALVASGQRAVIYAILINLAAYVLRTTIGPAFWVPALLGLALSLFGVYRLATGLGMSTWVKGLVVICMFVPLVSLVALFVLNSKATTMLRAAGYRVGLLGASK
jgi:hypothetical protein